MAYDEHLADRIRESVEGEPDLSEQRMFGGLAFLVGGNLAVAASGQGGLLLRVDPADSDRLTASAHVDRMVMRGRAMDGWLRVDAEAVEDEVDLRSWVEIGLDYARSLPPK
jgi:TfoX/Sxy family transcriptional regulator of competence genes